MQQVERDAEIIAGRFALEERIGHGAFGDVYRAVDAETNTRVALKRLRDDIGDSMMALRFEQESRLLARVRHPNVVRYVAHGCDGASRPWLALEWLEGEDLARRSLRSPVGLDEALGIVRETALALAALHGAGVIHRDVKPANIMLCTAASAGNRVKLIDLGVARAWAEPAVTVAGTVLGTPAYMAPEQVRASGDVGPAADVFSLGVVLFELLAGRRPFLGDAFALLARIALEDAPALRTVAPNAPASVAAIVDRALARSPARRFASATDLVSAIDALRMAGGAPTVAERATRSDSMRPMMLAVPRIVTVVLAAFEPTRDAERNARTFDERVAAHGGESHRTLGARAVGVFGLTRSDGGEPLRAARAALEAAHEIPGVQLAVVTSRVFAGAGVFAGDAIDRGATMVRAASSGVCVDSVTARLLDGRFEMREEAAGTLLVREQRDEPSTLSALGRTAPTVGREPELVTLRAVFDECVAESSPKIAVVTAPAGVGKSRLGREFVRRLRVDSTASVWLSRGRAGSSAPPLALLADGIRHVMRLADASTPGAQREAVIASVARSVSASDAPRVSEFLGELTNVPFDASESVPLRAARNDPRLMADQLLRAFLDWLDAECAVHPVVCVLDDFHWGDAASLSFLERAVSVLATRPLMLLVLARPELDRVFPNAFAAADVRRIALPPLSRHACVQLANELLGDRRDDAPVANIVERCAGNAFFLEELVRAAGEREGEALPDTIHALLQWRFDSLSPAARELLSLAGVFGSRVPRDALLAMRDTASSETSVAPDGLLGELASAELLVPRAPGEYRFRHALVRDAAYAALPERTVQRAHRAAACWLEARADAEAIVVAEHFDRGGDGASAARWYRRAAHDALRANDMAAAVTRAGRGIERGASGELLGELLLIRAEAHRWRGENAPASESAMGALQLLPRGSDAWCSAAGEVVGRSGASGASEAIREVASALGELLGEGVPSPALVTAASRAATVLMLAGESAQAISLLTRIEAGTRAVELPPAARARVLVANAHAALGDGDPARYVALLTEAVQHHDAAADLRTACLARVNIGFGLLELGDESAAAQSLTAAIADAERLALGHVVAMGKHNLGLALARSGAYAQALQTETAAVAAFRAQGNARMESGSRSYAALILSLSGDAPGALREARAAVAVAPPRSPARMFALAMVATVLLQRHDLDASSRDEAVRAASEAMALLEAQAGVDEGEALVRLAHAEALHAEGDFDGARAAIERARTRLLERAARINDARWSARFLGSVPENARTIERARDWLAPRSK